MKNPAEIEMPCYQSHKKVWALKIERIERHDSGSAHLHFAPIDGFERRAFEPIEVPLYFMTKHDPQPGGYFVVYEDGYTSFSPAGPFEAGYTREDGEPVLQRDAPAPAGDGLLTVAMAARICHELIVVYCEAIGDYSQKQWPFAPDWQKESAINQVKLHMHDDHGPEASHNAWMAEKVADGWVYGEGKDPDSKTHPCIVPFDQLPVEQQIKDVLFSQTVRALRPLLGVPS